ncbi:MAG: OPT/YSL family transporter [Betaproteobacteria bacterium]|nr:OPT/YSL family transporter [Betaproteobacteria bacterium]
MCVLGPLGGVTASYMNFSLGFFVGGQVLAGILGSTVTYGYGPEGKHGANYMQTAAASVASLSAMGVMIQAMVWMGLPQPPVWELVLFMLCTGMFAVGVGMLYTPLLVDRMQLTYPSGLAVANILRALTDPVLLKKSVARLGGGMAAGIAGGLGSAKIAALGAIELSTSTMGAGMLVGARIGIPAITSGLIFWAMTPWFVSIGWLKEGEPFRKIAFLIALGMILGAALIDVALVLKAAAARLGEKKPADDTPEWKRVNTARLVAWVVFWGVGVIASSHFVLGQPVGFIAFALFLVFVFALVNGISVGVCDQNPISSAFVVSVVLMAALGLKDPITGLFAGMILLIATNCASDMQQDRSTGWRLGTNRVHQFRYQVAGIAMGAVAAVVFAKLFMAAYPVLLLDQTVMKASEQPAQWSAAMTYKVVGVLRSLTDDQPYQRTAIWVGVAFGFVVQVLRLWLKALPSWQAFIARDRKGFVTGFVVDAFVLPTPYAFSFGGFVNLPTSLWFGGGGILSSFLNTIAKPKAGDDGDLPPDMNTTSLVGGGLIAGDSLAALGLGVAGLLATVAG